MSSTSPTLVVVDRATMFAVPGWKISADLLKSLPSSQTVAESSDAVPHGGISNSKKRKRDQPEQRISAQDLDRLWNKHFGTSAGEPKIAGKTKITGGTHEKVTNGERSKHAPPTAPNQKHA